MVKSSLKKLHASTSVYLSMHFSTGAPTAPDLELSASRGPDQKHSHTPVCRHTLPLYSLSPEPLSFLIGQSWWHHPMVWHICTKWLVFVYLSKYQDVLLWKKWKPWGKCKQVNIRQTVITLTLHVLFRPLTYALLIFNKGWTVLHINGQMSD